LQSKLLIAIGMAFGAAVTWGQTGSTASGAGASFTATTDNVSSPNDSIRIDVIRWSADAERDQLMTAWNQPNQPAAGAGGRGRGPGRGPADDAPASAGAGKAAPTSAAGRGGRGGRGGDAAPPALKTPEGSLAEALLKAPVVGYLWSSEVAGYALHYALRLPGDSGGDRIILITDRRLGAWNDQWKPSNPGEGANQEFSLIELRLSAKGEGEGKASITGKVAFDAATKTLGLENYSASPVIFKNVKRKAT
jgi:hypothetical protein